MLRLIIFIFLSLGFFASYSYAGSIVHRTNSTSDLSIDILNDKITFETNSKWWENVKDGIKNGRLFKYSIYISDNNSRGFHVNHLRIMIYFPTITVEFSF